MGTFVSGFLVILNGLAAIPVGLLLFETIAGIVLPQRKALLPSSEICPGRVAVLVPAHNESAGLTATLADIRAQLKVGDRVLVVADNCTDDTAVVAAIAGAEVIERHERERVGKGFALDYGLRHLDIESPDIVVVIDADCRLGASAIDALASMCAMSRRPTQALYLMTQASEARISDLVAEFAWRVKNWVRPLGLGALGLPCQLAGTGMAFPWNVIQTADLATGSIVEDLKLGLDLAAAGHAPLFCPSARVTSEFAASAKGAEIQRTRWEEGHLTMILQGLPRLIYTALVRRNMALLVLALDLAVPPLSLLMLLLIGLFTIAVAVAGIGLSCTPPVISGANLLALAVAVFLSWLKYGRDVLPWRAICLIPGYVVRKLPHYGRILLGRRTTRWIRTERK